MKLLEKHNILPLDVIRYINEFVKYKELNDKTIRIAVKLWFINKEKCKIKYGHISYWNVSNVTDMSSLFCECDFFNEDISRWNVSNVTNMSGIFSGAYSFNCDLSKWNVSNVTDMSCMFFEATSFNSDISNWNVEKVTVMVFMFYRASSFNCDLSKWKVSNRTSTYCIFFKSNFTKYDFFSNYFGYRKIPQWIKKCV